MARLGRRLCGKRGNVSKRKEGPAQSGGEDGKASKARKRAPGRRRKGTCLEDRPVLEPSAAGIDIGAREIFVAVPPDRDEDPVRVFATFTEDLEQMAGWLANCGITTVAIESTGVYWIPLYDVLERQGLKPCLVDARNMKNVPVGMNANGCSICIRWDCCGRHSGPKATFAQSGH